MAYNDREGRKPNVSLLTIWFDRSITRSRLELPIYWRMGWAAGAAAASAHIEDAVTESTALEHGFPTLRLRLRA